MWTAGYTYSWRKMESGVDWAYSKKALPRKHFSGCHMAAEEENDLEERDLVKKA